MSGGGRRSPPRGGVDPSGDNQQLLVDEPEAEGVPSAAGQCSLTSCPLQLGNKDWVIDHTHEHCCII